MRKKGRWNKWLDNMKSQQGILEMGIKVHPKYQNGVHETSIRLMHEIHTIVMKNQFSIFHLISSWQNKIILMKTLWICY